MAESGHYELEYSNRIKTILKYYMREIERKASDAWLVGKYVVREEVLENYLSIGCQWERYYVEERKKGKKRDEVCNELKKWIGDYKVPLDYLQREEAKCEISEHFWYNALARYQGSYVYYMTHENQLDIIKPLLERCTGWSILLSEFEIPGDVDLPESVVAIGVEFTGEGRFTNVFLECNFPLIFHYFTFFDLLVGSLRPIEVVMVKEKFFQNEILAEVCDVNKISLKFINPEVKKV